MDLSDYDQDAINSNDWEQSRFPAPGIDGAVNPGNWSWAAPNGRQVFAPGDPTQTFAGLCPNDEGALFCNLSGDGNGGFVPWSNALRFTYAPFNLLLTPSKRTSLFAQGSLPDEGAAECGPFSFSAGEAWLPVESGNQKSWSLTLRDCHGLVRCKLERRAGCLAPCTWRKRDRMAC